MTEEAIKRFERELYTGDEAPEPVTPVQPSSPAEEKYMTAEEEEALALAEAKKKKEAK